MKTVEIDGVQIVLDPCPFCGSDNIDMGPCTLRTRCKFCCASGPLISKFMKDGKTEHEAAADAWNARAKI